MLTMDIMNGLKELTSKYGEQVIKSVDFENDNIIFTNSFNKKFSYDTSYNRIKEIF